MRVENLSLGYGDKLVIDEIDLNLPGRAVTAIVGPNGSGKSTLLRGMARLLKPWCGSVYLDDTDVTTISSGDLAKRLGLLPQGPVVPEGLTVGDLVSRGRFPHRSWYQRWNADDEDAVHQALHRVGLLERAGEPVDQLSGGQRQRAWLAMVLAQDTAHLLLDEPTTYLDLAHAVDVMTVVRSVAHDGGRTVVCVLHDLTLAARFADHLVVLHRGRIAALGTPSEVLDEKLLRDVFELQARVIDIDGAPAVVPSRHT